MKFIKILVLGLSLLFVVVSCTDTPTFELEDKVNSVESIDDIQDHQRSQGTVNLNDLEIEEIGQMHNLYLRVALENANNTGNYKVDVRQSFLNQEFPDFIQPGKTYDELLDEVDQFKNDFDITIFDSSPQGFLNQLMSNLTDDHNENLSVIQKIREKANTKLSAQEFQKFDICITVAKYSSFFWCTEDNGGSGEGISLYNNYSQKRWFGKDTSEMIADDVIGAYGGAFSWGLAALAGGPLGLAGYAIAVGFGAAWSSAT